MNNLKYWLAFSKTTYSNSSFIRKVWNHFGCIREAWLASSGDLLKIEGIQQRAINNFVAGKTNIDLDALEEEFLKKNIKTLTIADKNYPYLLKEIPDPPAMLFIMGDTSICNTEKSLGVVGSRKSSRYITDILNKLIDELKDNNITITSGGAIGIDSCAHIAAIRNNMKTIAVIGSGFDHLYPKENKNLFKQIAEGNGAVISEYYPTEQPETWKFPKRNRIISGLSKGTLIAEAGLRSGALITARICLEQNRDLMCIPGAITNPNTEGIYKLIKEGAAVVTNAKDIFNTLNWQYDSNETYIENNPKINLLDNEQKIYEILNLEPKHFDDILNQSKFNVQNLMCILTTMELNGIIKQMPGQIYTKVI